MMMKHGGTIGFASEDMKMLLRGFRNFAIYSAVRQCQPTIFEQPQWMQLLAEGPSWSPRHRLLDIAAPLPGLLSRIDLNRHEQDESLQLRQDLQETHGQLDSWIKSFESVYDCMLYWGYDRPTPGTLVFQPTDIECQPRHRSERNQLEFLNGPVAGLLVAYWSFRLKLYLSELELDAKQRADIASPDVIENTSQKVSDAARATSVLILEAVPYLSSCLEGSLALQAPLVIVEEYYSRYENLT